MEADLFACGLHLFACGLHLDACGLLERELIAKRMRTDMDGRYDERRGPHEEVLGEVQLDQEEPCGSDRELAGRRDQNSQVLDHDSLLASCSSPFPLFYLSSFDSYLLISWRINSATLRRIKTMAYQFRTLSLHYTCNRIAGEIQAVDEPAFVRDVLIDATSDSRDFWGKESENSADEGSEAQLDQEPPLQVR
jgi:hypothetical protein